MAKNIKNNKKDTNNNTEAEKDYGKLKSENKELKQQLKNFQHTYRNIYIPLIIYITSVYKDSSDKDIEEFCKLTNMNLEIFKDIMQKAIKCCGIEINKIINETKDKSKKQKGKVGYKNPPIETRFQKGNKGNPKGRKSKKDLSLLELIINEVDKRICVTKNGQKKYLYSKEVIAQQISKQLMTGGRIYKNNINLINLIDRFVKLKKLRSSLNK